MSPRPYRRVNGGAVLNGPISAAGQPAARGEDSPDRYSAQKLTTPELERTRRDLTTSLGLTVADSAMRTSLTSHLDAVTAELGNREHPYEDQTMMMAIAPPAAGTRAWHGTYPAQPRQVSHARHAAGKFLSGCPLADETLLILSELTTNAVLHSRSKHDGEFTVRVEAHPDFVKIECQDSGGPWHIRPGEDGRPHGLDLVHALCGEDGWGVADLAAGRLVWARLDLT